MKFKIIYILLVFASSLLQAQKQGITKTSDRQDSLNYVDKPLKTIYYSPRKAAILSACLPGLGQAYNKKYWKMPIIYGVLGGIAYWGVTNHQQYKFYSRNLTAIYDEDEHTINTTFYSSSQLVTQRKYYKKYRDMAIMVGALAYFINIIDANVDAHLKTFDVSDDLSLQLNPYSTFDASNHLQTGLTLKLSFK